MLTAVSEIRSYARFASSKLVWYAAIVLIAYSLTWTTNHAVVGSESGTMIEGKTEMNRSRRSADVNEDNNSQQQYRFHHYNGGGQSQPLKSLPQLDSFPDHFPSIDYNSYDVEPEQISEEVFAEDQDGGFGQIFVAKESSANDKTHDKTITGKLSSKADLSNLNVGSKTEKRAPGWGKRAPGWGKRAPGWGKRAPGWGKRATTMKEISPGWGKRAPGWGKRAPGWGKRDHFSLGPQEP
ncbi:uncharacterized protein LOC115219332 [Argonauta hians]